MCRTQHVFRDPRDQTILDLAHGFARRQASPVADAEDMRIDRHRIRPEGNIHHDIRRLAPYTGQRFERRTVGRDLSAVTFQQLRA